MNSESIDKTVRQAVDLIGKDEVLSLQILQELISNNPGFAKAFCARGMVFHVMGIVDQALSDYERAIELDSCYARAIFNKGVLLFENGEFIESIVEFDKAVSIQPEPRFFFQRGRANLESGNLETALLDFDTCLDPASNSPMPYLFRGVTRARLGRFRRAIADFEKGIELDPDNSDLYLWKASTLLHLQLPAEALKTINIAIAKGDISAELRYQQRIALSLIESASD